MKRKGIILAGGLGTRLYPVTNIISKQLLPVYDKPMIYYPLATLMLADIKDILIITTPHELQSFQDLLGDGSKWGISLQYVTQEKPEGIAQAFILAEKFIGNDLSTLILGDNIFYGDNIETTLNSANNRKIGATIFLYPVDDPSRYGVAELNPKNQVVSLEEKPKFPKSDYAITGLYFYDQKVIEYAKSLTPSHRDELEITDINKKYLENENLFVEIMNQDHTWLDSGTHDSLLLSGQYIASIQNQKGLKVACLEEIAFKKKWISKNDLKILAKPLMKNQYGEYLKKIIDLI